MTGYAPFDGPALAAIALAVALSAIVSLIGSSSRRRAVEEGRATLQDLAELSGISDPQALLDAFGPPGVDRIWATVTLKEVERKRTPVGHAISNPLVDWACMATALGAFLIDSPFAGLALWAAAAVQAGGWIAASRLPK